MLSEALGLADKDGMTSIAFPAIGTGKLRFPGRVVANAMFDEVQKFSRSVKSSSVTDVRIVIFDKPTVEVSKIIEIAKYQDNGNKCLILY